MSLILLSKQRGTSSHNSEAVPKHRMIGDKNLITKFSTLDKSQKITVNKGTKTRRISKSSLIGIPSSRRVMILNSGTLRLNLA